MLRLSVPRAAQRLSIAAASSSLPRHFSAGIEDAASNPPNPLSGFADPPILNSRIPVPPPPKPLKPILQSSLYVPPAEDPVLFYFTSMIMNHGKRARARKITANVLLWIHGLTRAEPLPIFRAALLAASPVVRCMSWKQGAKMRTIPIALSEKQRTRGAIKAILAASEKRAGQNVAERVAREIVGVLQGESEALRKKEDAHKVAMVNRTNIVGLRRSGGR